MGSRKPNVAPLMDGGDLSFFSERFASSLERFFRKRAPDLQNESEDLVQDVFCRFLSRDNNTTINHPRRYLFRVATSVLNDRIRNKIARRSESHCELQEGLLAASEEDSPERIAISREELSILATVLKSLPEKVRVAFILHRFEDYTYKEIASKLGVSVSSVEKYIMNALVALSDGLKVGSDDDFPTN